MPQNNKAQQQKKKSPSSSEKGVSDSGSTGRTTPKRKQIHPPELLCDVELPERPEICSIVETMMISRRNILDNDKKWDTSNCNEMTDFLARQVFAPLLSQNVFLPLEIQDFFQSLLDFQLKMMKCDNNDKSLSMMSEVYRTKMKFVIIQIIDEIYKNLFRMEEEILEDESSEDESDVNNNIELYKKLRM